MEGLLPRLAPFLLIIVAMSFNIVLYRGSISVATSGPIRFITYANESFFAGAAKPILPPSPKIEKIQLRVP